MPGSIVVFRRIYVTKRNRINCGARQIGCVNFSRAFSRPRIVPWNFAGCKYSKGLFGRIFRFHETLKWKRSITIRSNLIIVISNGPHRCLFYIKTLTSGFYATGNILLHLISVFRTRKAPKRRVDSAIVVFQFFFFPQSYCFRQNAHVSVSINFEPNHRFAIHNYFHGSLSPFASVIEQRLDKTNFLDTS